MKITVEISMYPVRAEYLPPIKKFIDSLGSSGGIEMDVTPTSSRIIGEYDRVMDVLKEAMARSYDEFGTSVFVAKFLPNYEAL